MCYREIYVYLWMNLFKLSALRRNEFITQKPEVRWMMVVDIDG